MSDQFVGQIVMFGCNFAPKGWAFCLGQIMSISQNTALFSLLGTTYGGDGKSNFALPNLQGCAPVGAGQGPGLSDYFLGQSGGSGTITLSAAQMPQHTHAISLTSLTATAKCRNGAGNEGTPVGMVPAIESTGFMAPYTNAAPDAAMNAGAVALAGTPTAAVTGGDLPHENHQPYLAVNYCIALSGVYPPRT